MAGPPKGGAENSSGRSIDRLESPPRMDRNPALILTIDGRSSVISCETCSMCIGCELPYGGSCLDGRGKV